MFKNKKILITGGTGSFGKTMTKYLLKTNIEKIVILSRDEEKQDMIRNEFNDGRISFIIGDIRNYDDINRALYDINYVFHAAALKQVPSCEFYPFEAIKTNVIGTENVFKASINNHVEKAVLLSTDKAVYPINAMGISKAMAEKIMIANSRNKNNMNDYPIFCATRYGNVMASRGSVIPLFIKQIKEGSPITITNPSMTRFLMSLEESVDLVLYAFNNAVPGNIFVQKAVASTIENLAKALLKIFNANNEIKIIGIRHGEKNYETLVGKEEMARATDEGNFYKINSDNRDINYLDGNHIKQNHEKNRFDLEFNSDNAKILNNIDDIIEKLYSSECVRKLLPAKN